MINGRGSIRGKKKEERFSPPALSIPGTVNKGMRSKNSFRASVGGRPAPFGFSLSSASIDSFSFSIFCCTTSFFSWMLRSVSDTNLSSFGLSSIANLLRNLTPQKSPTTARNCVFLLLTRRNRSSKKT